MSLNLLAIEDGQPTHTQPWPITHFIDKADEERLLSALRQANWSNGELVKEFEDRFSTFCNCKHALLVVNGTTALKLALLAAGIKPGDEVILSGLTWPSVALAVIECGATPVTVDIDSQTYGLSVELIRDAINRRVKAIIPSHLFCSQTDISPILDLAELNNIVVIEDATHAVGARRFDKALGAFGIAGIFSFNQKKLLSCGEGGCLVTNDEALYLKAKNLRKINPEIKSPPSILPGTYMVSEFQAAVLVTQLEKLPIKLKLIEERAEFLRSRLAHIDEIEVLTRLSGTDLQTFYNFCFKIKGQNDITWFRKALSAELCLPISGAYIPLSETAVVDMTNIPHYSHLGRKLKMRLSNCMVAHYHEAVRFHHRALLADKSSIMDIVNAITKVLAASKR